MGLKPIVLKGEQKRVLFLQATDPIQIKGVAGSGKTTVALYRAKHLLDTQSNLFQEAKVAIFTYNKTLVKYINALKPHISGGYQADSDEIKPQKPKGINVQVNSFHSWAYHFLETNGYVMRNKTVMGDGQKEIFEIILQKNKNTKATILEKRVEFFIEEISWMKGKVFNTKEEYVEAKRSGRGREDRVSKADKEIIWKVYNDYQAYLKSQDFVDFDDYALMCLKILKDKPTLSKPFTHIIIDEAQDLSKAQVLVLSQLVSDQTKSISLIADAAQRIYKSGFTWSEVGINVRGGRTIEFKKNYRNTVQIVKAALSLLEKEDDKSDFTTVETAIKGEEKPTIGYFPTWDKQADFILAQLSTLKKENKLGSTVILHRSNNGIAAFKTLLEAKGYSVQELKNVQEMEFHSQTVKLCTMSSIKGLEFDNVIITDLNADIFPYPAGFSDDNDEYHISTERRLLYTCMTRAREKLMLLCSASPSMYLGEIDKQFVNVVNGA